MTLSIREAVNGDTDLILTLIRELALYERAPDAAKASAADIENALFCAHPKVHALIADWNGEAVGFAVYFFNFSTWTGKHGVYLEDLFVRETMRGKGIGKALLGKLAGVALNRNCARVEWAVLDWNEPAIGFYKSLGARPMTEWTVFRVEGAALDALEQAN
ncbi:MAG: GNAT family N-acetyltransferase [Parvularculaceae bacterium]|nr:GNAT family N-acetyltransferase [Parvularculaceae bacterium]